jgi:uncharacterized protein YkwD
MKKSIVKKMAVLLGLLSVMILSAAVTVSANNNAAATTIARTKPWDTIERTLGGVPDSVFKIEYAGSVFYLGEGVSNDNFLEVIALGSEAVKLNSPAGSDSLYRYPVYILWNANHSILLVHPIIFDYDDVLEAVSIPTSHPANLADSEVNKVVLSQPISAEAVVIPQQTRRTGTHIFFNELTLLSNSELTSLIERAPSQFDTRSATTMTNTAMTETEFATWTAEYFALGGINAFELEVIRLINAERAKLGLNPLAIMPHYMQAARFKSQEMFDLSYTSHISPVYGDIGAIIIRLGSNLGRSENIAPGGTPEAVVNALLTSTKGHRESLLSRNAAAIGIGHVGTGTSGRTTALIISADNLQAYIEGRRN